MSKCRDLDALFAPYADGDVATGDRVSVEAHLDRCPPCRDRVEIQRSVRGVMVARRAALRPGASEKLRARCAEHARASAPAPPSFASRIASRRWVPLSLAATLLIAVAAAFLFDLNNNVEALAAELTLDHMTCFQLAPERLKHADALTAAHDWAQKQGWTIEIPASSSSSDLELLGVRRCTIGGGRVAHMMYRWHGQPLSIFVVPHSVRQLHDQQAFVEKFGHEAVVWSGSDRTYVVLARAQPSELAPLVGYVRAHAR
jgi:anti-sigma factor RsiW